MRAKLFAAILGISAWRRVFLVVLGVLLCPSSARADDCRRIVSLAPSITESVFDVGLGSRLVGVTRFCRYPPEAQSIARVGGFYDMNVEQIVRLKPTHVFALHEHAETIRALRMLGLTVIELDHSHVQGIKDGIKALGQSCDAVASAESRIAELERKEAAVRASVEGSPKVRTLVSVGRANEQNGAPSVYVSGSDGFYTDIVSLAGGINVNEKATMAIPTVSEEGLKALAPDAIVEIVNVDDPTDAVSARDFWKRFSTLPAVAQGRIFVEADDYASIPGPRYVLLAEKLAKELHSRR